uniref:Aspartate beta-hydroxylase domain-containing protein 2 n=1 Tax=Denticeps clupeoides TaxID=299321 RepID=A0AAY4EHD3_9TELE
MLRAGGRDAVDEECQSSAVGTALCLALLFVWYCYRVGREQSAPALPGRPGPFVLLPADGPQGRQGPAAPPCPPNGSATASSLPMLPLHPGGRGLNHRLYHSLQDYAKRYTWSGMGRLHKGVRDPARHLLSVRPAPSIQKPEVFFLPDLPTAPFFPRDAQKHDVELLERSFPLLLAEFHSVYRPAPPRPGSSPPPGWKANGTPQGQWWTFYLVNQGTPLALNARRCPRTWRVLAQLRTFIGNNVFGNACFSVLGPGSTVSEHYGPTNVRLRCHLGLKVPPGCELVVGGEPQCWSEGSCLLFDDSFLHTAFHEGSAEDGPRAVFMVDLWHPNVAAAERQALDYIFTTPGPLTGPFRPSLTRLRTRAPV